MVQVQPHSLTLHLRIVRYPEDFTANSMTARRPVPAAKLDQIITTPPPCWTVGIEVFVLFCRLDFANCGAVHYGKTWSCVSKRHCSIHFVVCSNANFAHLSCAVMLILGRSGFLLTTLLNKQFLFSLFLNVLWRTLTFDMLTEA